MCLKKWVLTLSLFLIACHPVKPNLPLRIGLRLTPASLGQRLSLQQQMTVERAGQTHALEIALAIDSAQLTLVGLSMGQRVMSVHYDGKTLQVWRHPFLPPQVSGENVLEDLELTLWPIAAIRAALPQGWSITEQGLTRTLKFNQQIVTVIVYSSQQHWTGTIVLSNLRYHYRLTIQSANNVLP